MSRSRDKETNALTPLDPETRESDFPAAAEVVAEIGLDVVVDGGLAVIEGICDSLD